MRKFESFTPLRYFNYSFSSITTFFIVWRASPIGSYKINTDECVNYWFTSGGDIIRDHIGHYIKVLSSSYSSYLILKIGLKAILDGILLARGFSTSVIWVEANSTVAIQCVLWMEDYGQFKVFLDISETSSSSTKTWFPTSKERETRLQTRLVQKGWDQRCYQKCGPFDLLDILGHLCRLIEVDFPALL